MRMARAGAGGDVGPLLANVVAGNAEAWASFLARTWPAVEQQVASSRSLGPLRASADDRNEVVSLVFARLRRDNHRALRLFGDWHRRHPDKAFDDWLAIVTANVVRDHVSRRLAGGGSIERLVDTWTESLDDSGRRGSSRPPFTNSAAARQLLERAESSLPADQLGALTSWLRGHDFTEIASLHGLAGAQQAQAKVRAALGRLRHSVRG